MHGICIGNPHSEGIREENPRREGVRAENLCKEGILAEKEYCAGNPRRVGFLLSSGFVQNKKTRVFFLLLELRVDKAFQNQASIGRESKREEERDFSIVSEKCVQIHGRRPIYRQSNLHIEEL